MEEITKYNRFGKIKSRVFALIVLMLSCSLALSAFRSLSRKFDGKIVYKKVQNGFISNNYDLYLNQDYKNTINKDLSNQDIINFFVENLDDYRKVGVSYFTYEDAEISMIIKKEKWSPIILLNENVFIDQGMYWIFLTILGIIISFTIYFQSKKKPNNVHENNLDDEELDL